MFATIGATSASIRSSAQPKRPRCGTASALVATQRTIPSSTTFRFGTLQTMQAPVSLQSARGLVPHGPVATLAGHSRWRRAISEPQRSRFHPRSLGAVDSRKPAVARRATVELVTRHRTLCHLIREVSVRNGLFRLLVASSVLVVWLAYLTSRQTALYPTVAGPAAELVPMSLALGAIVVAIVGRLFTSSTSVAAVCMAVLVCSAALVAAQLGGPLANASGATVGGDYCGDFCRTAIMGRFVSFFGSSCRSRSGCQPGHSPPPRAPAETHRSPRAFVAPARSSTPASLPTACRRSGSTTFG